mgnify:CR=1 FL=1
MIRKMVRCLVVLCLIVAIEAKSPIIFIPGSFCSLLEVRVNTTLQPICPKSLDNQWTLLWLNVRLWEPEFLPCFHRIIQFVFNSSTNSFENPIGVEVRLLKNSTTGSFLDGLLWEYVGLDKMFYHFIKTFNYTDKLNLHSVPYDFRRGTNESLYEFIRNLKQLIEFTYNRNENQSVHLISHSTGGSMVLFFLSQQSQQWKDRFIQTWISLSGNLAGEVDNFEDILRGFVSPMIPKEILQTWDFYAWRLPEPFVFGSKRLLIQTTRKNYTSFDIQQFLNDINATDLAQIYPQTASILGDLPAPNVDTYCFYGVNVSTPIAYRIDEKNRLETIHGRGDGEQDDTTNMSCQLWNETMSDKYRLICKGFDRISHTRLVGNDQVLNEIDRVIRE